MKDILALELWQQLILLAPLGVILLTAAITDLRERKVYNWLTYPGFFIGLLAHAIALGWAGLLSGFLTALLVLVLGLLILTTGVMKGGDIKLFIVVGAFLGGRGLFDVFFYSVWAGFFIGVLMSLVNGYLRTLLARIWHLIKGYFLMILYGTKNFKPELEEDERSKMPFAVAIFAGGVCTVTDYLYGVPGLLIWYMKSMGFDA